MTLYLAWERIILPQSVFNFSISHSWVSGLAPTKQESVPGFQRRRGLRAGRVACYTHGKLYIHTKVQIRHLYCRLCTSHAMDTLSTSLWQLSRFGAQGTLFCSFPASRFLSMISRDICIGLKINYLCIC